MPASETKEAIGYGILYQRLFPLVKSIIFGKLKTP